MRQTMTYVLVVGFAALLPACDRPCDIYGRAGGPLAAYCEGGGDPGQPPAGDGCGSIDDASVPLMRYTQFTPDQKRNNPEAGDPSYIYLAAGREAVVIDGPPVMLAAPLKFDTPIISLVHQRPTSADGYHVVINGDLGYDVAIDDFEYEVTLARVEVCDKGGVAQSRFIFAASPDGDGVAHDITITAVVRGTPSGTSPPYTIEVR